MKLLLDLGNSRLKWALSAPGHWSSGILDGGGDSYPDALRALLAEHASVTTVWLSSVRHGAEQQRLLEVLQELGQDCQQATTPLEQAGLRNGYLNPAQLGVDRWLAMLAAWQPGHAVMVADCGTALTVDQVAADGQHLGGLIAPGPTAMIHALRARAPHLPAATAGSRQDLARDTATAIDSGCWQAAAALIDRSYRQAVESHAATSLLLSGGDAARLTTMLHSTHRVDQELVLRGLARYSELPHQRQVRRPER